MNAVNSTFGSDCAWPLIETTLSVAENHGLMNGNEFSVGYRSEKNRNILYISASPGRGMIKAVRNGTDFITVGDAPNPLAVTFDLLYDMLPAVEAVFSLRGNLQTLVPQVNSQATNAVGTYTHAREICATMDAVYPGIFAAGESDVIYTAFCNGVSELDVDKFLGKCAKVGVAKAELERIHG